MELYAATVLLGYALGAVPVAWLVARRHGVDLRTTADGNPGAWNALEQLGGRRAWPAFVGDGLKGTLAGALGWALTGEVWGAYAGVAAAMLGHAFPLLWLRGRGGKSVMTFAGGMFACAPPAALLALALCGAVTGATRSFALGARAGVFGVVPLQLALHPAHEAATTGGLMCLVGVLFLVRRAPQSATDSE